MSRSSTVRRSSVAATGAVLVGLALSSVGQPARAATAFNVGDVFAGVGAGQINRYSPTGSLIQTLDTQSNSLEDAGMCIDAAGNLRSTNFEANDMTMFNNAGSVVTHPWGGPFDAHPESCLTDAAGNIYVGQADGAANILKFDPTGKLLDSYAPPTGGRGTDWIDLAADQKTMYYTSEDSAIHRYDVSAKAPLADFASGLPGPCYALRIRVNAEVLVACASEVVRLDSSGSVTQTYTASSLGENSLFAMNLDPDGTSFWTADYTGGAIDKVDIATGKVLTTFSAPANPSVGGLEIFGEPTAAASDPCAVNSLSGPTQPTIAKTLYDTYLKNQPALASIVSDPKNSGPLSSQLSSALKPANPAGNEAACMVSLIANL